MAKDQSKLLLDQNIYHRILSKKTKHISFTQRFFDSLIEADLMAKGDELIYPYLTYQSLFEIVGYNNKNLHEINKICLPSIKKKLARITDPGDAKAVVFKIFFDECKKSYPFKKDGIIKSIRELRKYCSEYGNRFLDGIVKNFENGFWTDENFQMVIAFDRTYGYSYPDRLLQLISESLFYDIFQSLSRYGMSTLSRSIHMVLNSMISSERVEITSDVREDLKKLQKDIKYKDNEDLVDTVITQLCITGDYEDGKLTPVSCVACDDELTVIRRIVAYSAIINHTFHIFENQVNESGFKLKNGEVIFLTQQGEYIKTRKIETLGENFKFYE